MLPPVLEIKSRSYLLPWFGKLFCHSAASLSLYASQDLCCMPAALLSRWLVGPPLLSVFAALWHITNCSVLRIWFLAPPLTVQQWEICSLPHPCSPGHGQCSTPTSDVSG
jgi:hypothetical protein